MFADSAWVPPGLGCKSPSCADEPFTCGVTGGGSDPLGRAGVPWDSERRVWESIPCGTDAPGTAPAPAVPGRRPTPSNAAVAECCASASCLQPSPYTSYSDKLPFLTHFYLQSHAMWPEAGLLSAVVRKDLLGSSLSKAMTEFITPLPGSGKNPALVLGDLGSIPLRLPSPADRCRAPVLVEDHAGTLGHPIRPLASPCSHHAEPMSAPTARSKGRRMQSDTVMEIRH